MQTRLLRCLVLAVTFSLLSAPVGAQSESPPLETVRHVKIFPLPGGLNQIPVFNSNSPEIISEAGILLSSLPGPEGSQLPFLDYAFQGDFGVFAHHIARDKTPGERLLCLGLIATNLGETPLVLSLKSGASYLSQPEALFRPLPTLANNADARLYAGPGDRVTTELLAGQSPLKPVNFEVPARSSVLVSSLPIPTDVAILPPVNGRSTLMNFHSSGPVHLSHVALFARRENGRFVMPTLADYQQVLNDRKLAGTREPEPSALNPEDPPPASGFRFGRVAGIQQGDQWSAEIFKHIEVLQMPGPGEITAFPIAATYLKRYGSGQNQAAPLLRRYPDTAHQAHGNYGVRYQLNLALNNPDPVFRTYLLRLSHPARSSGPTHRTALTYLFPPAAQVVFRGSVRLEWTDETGARHDQLHHLNLRHGEEAPPLTSLTVPPGRHYDLRVSLYYPADATTPQLLTLERLD